MVEVRSTTNAEEFAAAVYGIAQYFGGPLTEDRRERFNAVLAYERPLERHGVARFVTPEEAAEVFPPVFEAVMRERPGVFRRTEPWWRLRTLRMPEEDAAHPKRFVALELDDAVQAYAIYRQHH